MGVRQMYRMIASSKTIQNCRLIAAVCFGSLSCGFAALGLIGIGAAFLGLYIPAIVQWANGPATE